MSSAGYSYDAITGEICIFKGEITGDVTIQADAIPVVVPEKEFYVSFRLTNLTAKGSNKAVENSDYEATLVPDTNYSLPASFVVKSGNFS